MHLGLVKVSMDLCLGETAFLKVYLWAGDFIKGLFVKGDFLTFSKINMMMFTLKCNTAGHTLITENLSSGLDSCL